MRFLKRFRERGLKKKVIDDLEIFDTRTVHQNYLN